MKQLKRLVESEIYAKAIQEICQSVQIKIYPGYEELLLKIDSEELERAMISVDDLESILLTDYQKIISFAAAKIVKFGKEEAIQEYPEGEEPDEDDKDDNIIHHGYSKGFLLLYATEYFILKYKPDTLAHFLKISRIPQAKKYAKELNDLYKAAQKINNT